MTRKQEIIEDTREHTDKVILASPSTKMSVNYSPRYHTVKRKEIYTIYFANIRMNEIINHI